MNVITAIWDVMIPEKEIETRLKKKPLESINGNNIIHIVRVCLFHFYEANNLNDCRPSCRLPIF